MISAHKKIFSDYSNFSRKQLVAEINAALKSSYHFHNICKNDLSILLHYITRLKHEKYK